jgi:membrane protein YdbS with pleckstrin-like domain
VKVPLPRSRGSQIYLLLLVGVAVGLVLVAFGAWRAGLMVVGVTFVLGAIARVVVPPDHVGMLRVRGRTFDIVWMTLLGGSLALLALLVPPGPPA